MAARQGAAAFRLALLAGRSQRAYSSAAGGLLSRPRPLLQQQTPWAVSGPLVGLWRGYADRACRTRWPAEPLLARPAPNWKARHAASRRMREGGGGRARATHAPPPSYTHARTRSPSFVRVHAVPAHTEMAMPSLSPTMTQARRGRSARPQQPHALHPPHPPSTSSPPPSCCRATSLPGSRRRATRSRQVRGPAARRPQHQVTRTRARPSALSPAPT